MSRWAFVVSRSNLAMLHAWLDRVEMGAPSGCWLWAGAQSSDGYGYLYPPGQDRGERRAIRAHRWSVLTSGRALPDDAVVLHRCDTPLCVNPDHLTVGTHADNVADMIAKGRRRKVTGWTFSLPPGSRSGERHSQYGKRKTACKNGHEFTPENTGQAHNGSRRCKQCSRIRSLARYHRLRAEPRS